MGNTVLILLLTAFLPGASVYRFAAARRADRAALPVEERLFWAVLLSAAISSAVGLGLAVAGAYDIDSLLWINGGLSAAAGAASFVAARRRTRTSAPPPARRRFSAAWTAVPPLVLAVLAAGIFFAVPPAEYVVGGRDPGVYVNAGIRIAQHGSLVPVDPVVAALPAEHRPLFFRPPGPPRYERDYAAINPGHDSVRFMGFFILDPDRGTVVGQFPHLYPLWIAIAYDALGLTGARYVLGAWAVLGVLAVYFAGAWLVGRPAACAGAALLALNVVQVWYARYPNAEIIVQALTFAGLLAHARAQTDDDRFFGTAAGGLLGLTVFAHFTGVLVIGAAVIAAILGRAAGHRLRASFVLAIAATTAAAAAYYLLVLTPYSARPISYVRTLAPTHILLLAAGAAGLAALSAVMHRPGARARIRAWLPGGLLAAVWILAVYALFFREPGRRLDQHDVDGLRTYAAFYLQPLGLLAALAGWAVVSGQRFWRGAGLIIVPATFSFFIFFQLRVVPEHFWMARRFLPIILPASLLLAGAAAFTHATLPGWNGLAWARTAVAVRARTAVGAALVVWLGWTYAGATGAILRHVEFAGLIPRIEQIAADVTPADLLIVESRAASDLHVLATPLSYVYARHALVLTDTAPDKRAFEHFLDWARSRYARVLFMGYGGTDLLSQNTAGRLLSGERFSVPQYEESVDAYPTGVRRKDFAYGIYKIVPRREPPGDFDLDVGSDDDLLVRRMHAKQVDARNATYRWTRDRSYVSVVATPSEAREVTLHLSSGGRPAAAGETEVRVFLDDRPLGAVTVDDGFRPYTLAIPPDVARDVAEADGAALRLETAVWTPREVLGTPDDRDLGVMLDRVEIR